MEGEFVISKSSLLNYYFIFQLVKLIEVLTNPMIGIYCYNVVPLDIDTFCEVRIQWLNNHFANF